MSNLNVSKKSATKPDSPTKVETDPTSKLTARFSDAFAFANQMHAGQHRKQSTTPYIAHLMAVSGKVLENGGDEELAMAGLLHDVVEDCGGLTVLAEVRERFGNRVANIVEACTDNLGPRMSWRDRKQQYLDHLREANADVRLVMAADKLHNVGTIVQAYREIGEQVWARFSGGREGSLWYYRELANELARDNNTLTKELQRAVAKIERMAAQAEPDEGDDNDDDNAVNGNR